jgi:hypothetical protein
VTVDLVDGGSGKMRFAPDVVVFFESRPGP